MVRSYLGKIKGIKLICCWGGTLVKAKNSVPKFTLSSKQEKEREREKNMAALHGGPITKGNMQKKKVAS